MPSLRPLLLTFFTLAACLSQARSQGEVPPGYRLVDDMFLPIGQEASYTGTPWTGGLVYYDFDGNVTAQNQARSLTAMAEWAAVANVRFIPRTTQANYIHFQNSNGNNSFVGMIGGPQTLNMFNWNFKYIICHELAHALGFRHEQTRPDRDTFVTINFGNICCNASSNFQINPSATTTGAYDFLSIMHYGRTAFSTGSADTITCKPAYAQFQNQIGNRSYMTLMDADGLAQRYGPPPPPTITATTPASVTSGGPSFTLTVSGTRFNEGASQGVGGSRIVFNGTTLATSYISPTQLSAFVPASLIAAGGCFEVSVENPQPAGGGLSTPWPLTPVGGPSGGPFDWVGSQDLSLFGTSVASGGDLNGDRLMDTLIGAPEAGSGDGEVQIFSGADGLAYRSHQGQNSEEFGASVAILGDLSGDGIADYAIGAPGFTTGRVLIYSGASGTLIRTLTGPQAGSEYGATLAPAGDLNGDGRADILVGAPGETVDRGAVYAYSGLDGSLLHSFQGVDSADRFGDAISGGRDANGDGVPDILVGAPRANSSFFPEGAVTLYDGANGATLGNWTADAIFDEFGASVAFAGDLNADGSSEIAVGMLTTGVLGPAGPGRVRVIDPVANTALFTVDGDSVNDRFGSALCSVGDIDQDGFMDLAATATQSGGNPGAGELGYAVIISGKDGQPLWRVSGTAPGVGYGSNVAFHRLDSDSDGAFEILLGLPGAAGACGNTGRVIIENIPAAAPHDRVMITEISLDAIEAIEITNFSAQSKDLSNWTLGHKSTQVDFHSGPLGVTLAPGEIIVISELGIPTGGIAPGVQHLQILPPSTNLSLETTTALFDERGLVVDEVRVANLGGTHSIGSLGGRFRDLASRFAFPLTPHVERIWGLDSNGGSDWTRQATSSLGLENQSDGTRSPESGALAAVVINEISITPLYIEFQNTGATAVNPMGWKLMGSPGNQLSHDTLYPWHHPLSIPAGGYFVIGAGPAPSELPASVPYVDLVAEQLGVLNYGQDEMDCALYDEHGRLLDLVRGKAGLGLLTHNDPRAPSHWSDFEGTGGRETAIQNGLFGRMAGPDTNTGSDWSPTGTRTMGSVNSGFSGPLGWPGDIDVRFSDTLQGGGVTLILNAGVPMGGKDYTLILSGVPMNGQGPFFGLDVDAILFFQTFGSVAPFGDVLSPTGSRRFDLPPGSIPGFSFDGMVFVIDPALGIIAQTMVLELRT